jgi:hypothetical protein
MAWMMPIVVFLSGESAHAEKWTFKEEFVSQLVEKVPELLKSQDRATGRFGKGVWICRDQEAIFPLAAAWSIKSAANPFFHDPAVLEAIMAGGDALIAEQTPKGQWIFRKKDNSTWGDIYMPWTYSRWIRSFALIKDAMPADRREKWRRALTLGFDGIVATELTKPVQNIPAHDAMATFLAGQVFNRPDYCDAARAYMKKVVDAQASDGYWSEHSGPVVLYGFVYVEAVGTYYAFSHDDYVLPALKRSAQFHAAFTYPDGSRVETVDERNGYEKSTVMPNIGFTFSPAGRGYAHRQYQMKRQGKQPLSADLLASYILNGQEGQAIPPPSAQDDSQFVTTDGQASTTRKSPWFACLSAYHAPVAQNRWIQDRQNLVSLFHDDVGLIVGGGNTKLQPLWSTFTVGDVRLLAHKPGDEDPSFLPPAGLVHIPTTAALSDGGLGLKAVYGDAECAVRLDLSDPRRAKLIYSLVSSNQKNVQAHVTLLAHMKQPWKCASGKAGKLSAAPFELKSGEIGSWFEHAGWRVVLPPQASIQWPVLPHDQYRKDGQAEPAQGRIVVTLPFHDGITEYEVDVTVP